MAATVWTGRLAFGLVSIPVRLYRAARHERTRFHQVYRPAARPQPEAEEPDEPEDIAEIEPEPPPRTRRPTLVPPPAPRLVRQPEPSLPAPVERVHHAPAAEAREILKGFEYEKGRYVVLEPEEVKALRPRTSSELEILEFVALPEIDPIYFDTSYYVAPDKNGEKPYAMLYEALRNEKHAALGTFAMHGREHASVIRPGRHGLILHTLYYENEIRGADEYRVLPDQVSAKELQLAELLVRELTAKFDPTKFKNTFEERVKELIEQRAQSGLAAAEGAAPETPKAPAVDILEALRKSLELVRKPPAQAVESAAAPPRKRRGHSKP